MTGTNCTLDAARNGPEKPKLLLKKERLIDPISKPKKIGQIGSLPIKFLLFAGHLSGQT